MPLLPRLAPVVGRAPVSPARLVLASGLLVILLGGVALVGLRLAQAALASSSPLAGGALLLALGFVAAVCYGIARDSTIGILIWLVCTIVVPFAPGAGFLAVDRLVFLALVGAWFIEVISGRRELGRFGHTEFLMLCFVILSFASIMAPHEFEAVGERGEPRSLVELILTSAFLPFAGFVLARQTLIDERSIRRFLWLLVWFGTYLALTNIFWSLGANSLIFPEEILDPSVGIHANRGRGIFLNAAATGYVLVVCFVATMHLAHHGARLRRLLPILGILMIVGVGLTQTRSAWVAAAVVVVVSAIAFKGFRRWYIVILVGALGLAALNWQSFTSEDRSQGGVSSREEAQDRLNATATALWAVEEKPLFGWGLGRFPAVNTVHHQQWGDTPWNRGYGIFPHDTQLGIAAELGGIGLALWLTIIGSMIVASVRAWRALPRSGLISRDFVVGAWCVGVAYLITASLIDIRFFSFANIVFFIFGGICAGLADRMAREAAQRRAGPAPGGATDDRLPLRPYRGGEGALG
jgi:O-antigen ligase